MKHYCIQRVLNLSLCLVFLFSLVGVPPVQAGSLPIQPQSLPGPAPVSAVSDAAPTPPPPPAGSRLGYNSVTGRLNFVGGDAAAPLARAGEMSAMGVRSAADGVLAQYAPQFGVQNPAKDLRLARTTQDNHGSAMRYQQTYQGIPILGGELIVNSDTQGHVLSLNGEVSPDLALSTPSPAISAQLALQSALDGAKGWYGLDAAQIVASQPALWIYDPRILQEDNDNPVSLVWRLELRANASSGPVDELVLVDATSGVIDLHFSQVEHSDATYDDPSGSTPTPEAVPTETPAASPTSEPPATETPRETATSQPTATPLVDNTSTQPAAVPTETPLAATEAPHLGEQVQSGITWYVAPPPAGSDTNDCAAPATPCTTINSAFGKASAGDTVEAAAGTYTGSGSVMVLINKSVNLSGGWNADFSSQDGYSVLDGQNQRCGILVGTGDHSSSQPAVTSELDRLILTRGASNGQTICWSTAGIIGDPNSYLTIKNSSIQNSISPKNDLGLRSYVGNSLSVINSTITSHVFGVSISDTFQIDLRNVSIVNNPSGGLGIGATAARAANVHVHIVNSMIANNNGPNPDCDFLNIKNVSGGYNLIQDIGGNCGYTPQTGDIIATDPKIGALMPEGYYKLLPGSAAIDSGDPDVPGSGGNTCEVTDQLGNIRPIDGDNDGTPRCDIGAFETTPPTPPAVNQGGIIGNSVLNAILNTAYAPFSVKVTDQYGLPVSDAQVTLNAPSSGASGQFAGSTSSQVVLFTGNDGVANAPIFTANGLAGIYNVQATTPGVDEPAIFEMENYLPAPGSIVVSAGDKQKVSPGNVFPADLKAIVQDQHGRTMPGVTVTFTAPLSGASATFNTTGNSVATAISDNNGFASVTATANDTSGLYTVSASVAGISQTADFTLINIILYVSQSGNDGTTSSPNDCHSPTAPCLTVSHALSSMANGHFDMRLAGGTFSERINITYDYVNLSGGWNENFSAQNSRTIFQNGSDLATDISVSSSHVEISKLSFENSYRGIYTFGGKSDIFLQNVVFLNNHIGIENSSLGTTVINATFSQNTTAILSDNKPTPVLHLKNITAAGNQVGLSTVGWDTGATPISITIQNSILAANDINCQITSPATVNSEGYNIWGTSPGCVVTGSGTFNASFSDQNGVDPILSDLIDNNHFALLSGSPAIDAISGPDTFCPPDDIRSISRPVGAGCDIGAYEYQAPVLPYQLAVYSGDNQVMIAGRPLVSPFQAIVLDPYGTPIQGATVTFSAPISGPGGIFKNTGSPTISAVTDSSGIATADAFITNSLVGDYHISASAPGSTKQADFASTNAGISVYLDAANGNDANNCRTSTTPCQSFNVAVSRLKPWEVLAITANNQFIPDNYSTTNTQFFISGGWDITFEHQIGQTILSTGNVCNSGWFPIGGNSYLYTDRIDIQSESVRNSGTFIFNDGAIAHIPEGIQNQGTLIMTNATVAGNSSDDCPGGGYFIYPAVSNNGGSVLLTNVTVTANVLFYEESEIRKNPGMGINNYSGSVKIKNTLVAHNRSLFGYDLSGEITSLGHNLIGIIDDSQFIPAEGDKYGTAGRLQKTGVMGPADNGGGTITAALLPGSPAIGAGDPAACPATDQRGTARPTGEACSIGAFEGSLAVTDPLPSIRIYANEGGYYDRIGPLICKTPSPSCTNGGNPAADSIYQIITDMHAFLWDHYQRISLDNDAMPIYALINMEDETTSWDGDYLYVNHSSPIADDVIGHELIHGVIQSEADLFNYYQSGAIAESLADLWGEYFDQTNGRGNDSDQVRWLIGEDDTSTTHHRSMKDPSVDSMTSTHYSRNRDDNGGIHTNSGVNDKAVFLMVDGGTFNGKTVSPLGWKKVEDIYYYALTHLLTSGSDYADLYVDLDQACQTLVGGEKGITPNDCQQARNATDAVRMDYRVNNETNNICPSGTLKVPNKLFFDDFEHGSGQWQFGSYLGNPRWGIAYGYAANGKYSLYGNDFDSTVGFLVSDTYASLKNDVVVPSGVSTYLYFRHSYDFEYYTENYGNHAFDGGVVEYSTSRGLTWADASSLFNAGQNYSGTLYKSNPLSGKRAYTNASQGYVSTRYNLGGLAGKPVRFRWRMATDSSEYSLGWLIDDVEIYSCEGNPGMPSLKSPANAALASGYRPKLDWGDASYANHYQLQLSTGNSFSDLVPDPLNVPVSEYTPTADLTVNTTYYWRVRTFNSNGVPSKWSSLFSFRTPLLPPNLADPANLSSPSSLRPTFQWNAINGATSYTFQVSTSSTFTSSVINTSVSTSSFTPTSSMPANKILYWRAQARGANPSNWSIPFAFMIPSPPNIPHLIAPADKSLIDSYAPLLDWTDVTSPPGSLYDYYLLQIATDATFSNRLPDIKVNDLANSQKIPDNPLQPNQTYYWRVSAGGSLGQSSVWSSAFSFHTPLPTPGLIVPVDKTTVFTTRPAFDWNDAPGANSYAFQLSTSPTFASTVVNTSLTSSLYTCTSDLARDTAFYWHVQAKGANPSVWSTTYTFHSANPPAIPAPVYPPKNSIVMVNPPVMQWSAIYGADHYQLQVATSSSFSDTSLVFFGAAAPSIIPPSTSLPNLLTPNRTFFWRVRSLNSSSQYSLWSSALSFHTSLPAPVLIEPRQDEGSLPQRPTFSWAPVSEATGYVIQLTQYDDTFPNTVINKTITTTTFTVPTDFPLGSYYYWRVKALGTYPGPWSEVREFTIKYH